MKKTLLLYLFVCFANTYAQNSLNDYKYVIVEKQFHFQTEPDQYNLNELTRFLLKKNGFRPILESDIFPNDLKSNYCLALQSEVKASGFLKTTVFIILKDCNNNILFEASGTTKEKNFDKVYSYGLRLAFENFKEISYEYNPKEAETASVSAFNSQSAVQDKSEEISKLKAEIADLKIKNNEFDSSSSLVNTDVSAKLVQPIDANKTKDTLYYKAIANDSGFDLVQNDSKETVYVLIKTGMKNVYTVKGKSGIVYKKKNKWIFEYTVNRETKIEVLNIEF
jgi:hypothetical protein